MISYIKGKILEKKPGEVVVDVNGIGYRAHVPLSTYFKLGSVGEETSLFISIFIREDSINLYGFFTRTEREIFEKLTKINGVGPKLALNILSGIEPKEFTDTIERGEVHRLYSLPGVGKKTAMRVIVELSGKLKFNERQNTLKEDIISALVNLGYKKKDVIDIVEKTLRISKSEDGFEKVFKDVLKAILRK
ncbi:MAG: Holliday junction branch migration protein RuvA [Candidatus Aminicenantia bacterium]